MPGKSMSDQSGLRPFTDSRKARSLLGKQGVEGRDKPLPRIEQRLERHRLASHFPELSVIEAGDVPAPRSQKLRNRPVVADQVHEKGLEQVPADAFPVQQQRDGRTGRADAAGRAPRTSCLHRHR